MFANRHGVGAGWTRAFLTAAFAAAVAAQLGPPGTPRTAHAEEKNQGLFGGWKLFGGSQDRTPANSAAERSVRGQNDSESPLSDAVSTVTDSTSKAYRTVASGTTKAYNTVASGTSRAFRSTKETLLPWTASDAQPAKKTVKRREPPPPKGEVIVKYWWEFWKPEPEAPPKPKTVGDFLNLPMLE